MGRSPLLTLGPSWPFTIFLVLIGMAIFLYFMLMIHAAGIENNVFGLMVYLGLAVNFAMLFGGILKNPGMP